MPMFAYILVTMSSGTEKEALEKISGFDEVIEANLVVGEHDAVLKVKVKNISQLDTFLTDKLRALPDVYLTTTMIITERFK